MKDRKSGHSLVEKKKKKKKEKQIFCITYAVGSIIPAFQLNVVS